MGPTEANDQMNSLSLLNSINTTVSTLPGVAVPPRGWHDVNDPMTRPLVVLLRSTAHELWTTTGTSATKDAPHRRTDKASQTALLQAEAECQPRHPVTSGHMPMHRHVPAERRSPAKTKKRAA
jgi:hypothetical protein